MEPDNDYDFPCSALFRGIDVPDTHKHIEYPWPEPADERWFARLHGEEPEELSESPTKADIERLWQYVAQIRRDVGQTKQPDSPSISSRYKDEA